MKTRRGGVNWKKAVASIGALMGVTSAQQPSSRMEISKTSNQDLLRIGLKLEGKNESHLDSLSSDRSNSYRFELTHPLLLIQMLDEEKINYKDIGNYPDPNHYLLFEKENGGEYARITFKRGSFTLKFKWGYYKYNKALWAICAIAGGVLKAYHNRRRVNPFHAYAMPFNIETHLMPHNIETLLYTTAAPGVIKTRRGGVK